MSDLREDLNPSGLESVLNLGPHPDTSPRPVENTDYTIRLAIRHLNSAIMQIESLILPDTAAYELRYARDYAYESQSYLKSLI